METLWQDVKYGARQLARNPGYTAVAVLTLALGIGANASVFSVINSVLLRPLPIDDKEGLVFVHRSTPERPYHAHSYPEYDDYLGQSDSFVGLTGYSLMPLVFSEGDRTKQVFGEVVTGNYFSVLKVQPAIGRPLSPQDDHPSAAPATVVSYSFWVRHMDQDPARVGKTVVLNSQAFTVVGVAPRAFTGTTPGVSTDLWMPVSIWAQAVGEQYRLRRPEGYGHHWVEIIGRLKPEVSREQAAAALTTIAHRRALRGDADTADMRIVLTPVDGGHPGLRSDLLGEGLPVFLGLLALCGVLLLIPCANAASLLLARAATRQREIAVRLTLGSSRSRLIRQLLTESLLLAVLAGVVGFLIAAWATDLLAAVKLPIPLPTLALDLKLDLRVVSCLFLLPAVTGVAFGLLPALECSRPDLAASLKAEVKTFATSGIRFRLRDLVVVGQVAVSVVLLVVAGLFTRGLLKGFLVDPGFRSDNVLLLSLDPATFGQPTTKMKDFDRQLLERLLQTPGVEAASVVTPVPLSFGGSFAYYSVEGNDGLALRRLPNTYIGPGYFDTLSIPLVRGRDFSFSDNESAPLQAIVNETMARQFWSSEDPIGKRIRSEGSNTWIEVIGVAKDAKYQSLGEPPQPWMYLPALQHPEDAQGGLALLVRTTGTPMMLVPEVNRAMKEIDANFPVLGFQTLAESIEIQLLIPRIGATVVGVIGLLGLFLAMVGLFGVMSYTITQRTREMGVRMALGAQAGHILRLVIGRGLLLTMIGAVLGAAVAASLSLLLFSIPVISYLLFGISPVDPMTFVACLTLTVVVALAACWVPARRAMRVDPMTALRYE